MKALVVFLLFSMLAPMTSLAENATPVAETPAPTEVVADPVIEESGEVEETPTPEAISEPTAEAAPAGQRMAPLAEGGPEVTVDGGTGTVVVGGGRVVSIDFPAQAVASRFSDANCTNRTGSWASSSYQYVFSPGTYSVQARAVSEYGAPGNCVTIVVVEVPLIMFNGSLEPPYLAPNEAVNISSTAGSEWGMFNEGCIGSPINGAWSSAAGLHSSSSLTTTWFMARSIQSPQLTGPCTPVHVVSDTTPTVTLFGSTEPAFVPRFFWARPEKPAEAELGEFNRADCSGEPVNGWVTSLGVSPSTYLTIYFQARWKGDDSTRGNCLAVTWEPVSEPVLAAKVCGDNNDVVTPPKVQTAISFTDTGWVNNERTITLVNDARLYSFSSSQQTVFVFEDDGPCEPVTPIPPVQTKICGTNNDAISFPNNQPAGVIVDQSESWSEDSTWTVSFTAETGYIFPADTKTQYLFEDEGPCETGAPIPPVQTEVCGTNNDVISFTGDQPAGVIVTQSEGWSEESSWTVTFSAAEHYFLPDDTVTGYIFTDKGPCETDAPIPPVQTEVCGTNNDVISFDGDQPDNVIVTQSEDWSPEGSWTVTVSAAEHHVLPDDTTTEYIFTDQGPCETDAPIPPVQTEVCGTNNDVISFDGDQPDNIIVTQSEDWSPEGIWTVTFSAAEHHVLPDDTTTEYTFTDEGPCETAAPIPPVQTEVCGTNNDVISFDGDQPENVLVTQSEDWNEDGTWTVTFAAAEHYILPLDTQTEYLFTDAAIPCPTDAPAPPVQSAVCGPDNDLITIPDDQPEAITLDSDSGWENNTRTITFAVAPDFQTDGPTTFTFADAGEPCPIPTMRVTIQLQTSDGGSIAGSPWQLYAPVAALLPITDPYLEGTVGAGNQIELDDLIAGHYRLVVNADGYEAIDETFTIAEGAEQQSITLQAQAIQVPAETPTPSPTTAPAETVEPSPTDVAMGTPAAPATVEPTPASTAAAVSALPNTGSGSGMPGIAYLSGLVLIVAATGAFTRRPAR